MKARFHATLDEIDARRVERVAARRQSVRRSRIPRRPRTQRRASSRRRAGSRITSVSTTASGWSPPRRSISKAIRTANSFSTGPGPARTRDTGFRTIRNSFALCRIRRSPDRGCWSIAAATRPRFARCSIATIRGEARRLGLSSAHLNFAAAADVEAFEDDAWLPRFDWQFHWRNEGWRDFDEFLAALNHKKRKNIRQERARVARAGVTCEIRHGDEIDDREWRALHGFYLADVRRQRQFPGVDARFLPPSRPNDAAPRARRAVPPRRTPDRRRAVVAQLDDAVRTLLGQRGRSRRPPLRSVLLPGHRLLPARRPPVASSPARRASTSSRADSCRRERIRFTGSRMRVSAARSPMRSHANAACCEDYGEELLEHSPYRCSDPHPVPGPARCRTNFRRSTKRCASRIGLLAAGGDLSPERLLAAYRRGIFPWYSRGQPILWWSPDPRTVFATDRMHVPRRLARSLRTCDVDDPRGQRVRRGRARLRRAAHCASAARGSTRRCARPISDCTSSVTRIRSRRGMAMRSSAASMASRSDACSSANRCSARPRTARRSHCSRWRGALRQWDFPLLDAQVASPHLFTLGAIEIERAEFCARVRSFAT